MRHTRATDRRALHHHQGVAYGAQHPGGDSPAEMGSKHPYTVCPGHPYLLCIESDRRLDDKIQNPALGFGRCPVDRGGDWTGVLEL